MGSLGITVEVVRTAEETGGELLEMEVEGRPRGFLNQRHVHDSQIERLTMIRGRMKVAMNGQEHLVGEGDSIEIPAGVAHTQRPVGKGSGRVRIEVRPAGRTQAFMEFLARLAREGRLSRLGFPKPQAAADLILQFADTGHAISPPLSVQRGVARVILAVARPRPYVFVDEWDVAAPPEAVFDAVADARTYPVWWAPVYIDVESAGAPGLGAELRQHFKGRFPYHLRTRSVITEFDRPATVTAEVDGDLRGRGTWTVTPTVRGTHVRFDWQVHADRRLLRVLTPVLRPAFRWNHNWAIARAMEGLEPYTQRPDSPQ
ncbi:MAG: SRPBCC family protein [Solirubrobacterales bacterium]|nr:SRPBCC family protein [Solirubrobacterales bacterium]MBV9166557.1 SRPBCC family protein [Solirubrobacterales bacterium]